MSSTVLAITVGLLADDAPPNTGPEFGKASPLGLLVVVLLLLGTSGLVWSMNRQLKKVPTSFDDPGAETDTPPADAEPSGADEIVSPDESGDAGAGR